MERLGLMGRGRAPVRRRRGRRGAGFFGNIWKGIKSAANWVKDNKLISKGLALIPHPAGKAGAIAASALGLGRRRRRVVRRGRGIKDILKKAHNYVRDKKLISSALRHFGHSKLSKVAHAAGYGKSRRVYRKRRGGGIRDILKKAHNYVRDKKLISSALRHFGHSTLSKVAHAAGYGRSRRRVYRRRR